MSSPPETELAPTLHRVLSTSQKHAQHPFPPFQSKLDTPNSIGYTLCKHERNRVPLCRTPLQAYMP